MSASSAPRECDVMQLAHHYDLSEDSLVLPALLEDRLKLR